MTSPASAPAPAPKRDSFIIRLLVPAEPSKLRLGLLAALLLLWIAILVILYITTVKPVREHQPTATQSVALSGGHELCDPLTDH